MNCECNDIVKPPYKMVDKYNCYAATLKQLYNLLSDCTADPTISDIYMHVRHNAFALAVIKDNNWDLTQLDVDLTTLGIDSNLTPDLILNNEKGKLAIDFCVTTDLSTALTNKMRKYDFLREFGYEIHVIAFNYKNLEIFSTLQIKEGWYSALITKLFDELEPINGRLTKQNYGFEEIHLDKCMDPPQMQPYLDPCNILLKPITINDLKKNAPRLLKELEDLPGYARYWLSYNYNSESFQFLTGVNPEFKDKLSKKNKLKVSEWERMLNTELSLKNVLLVYDDVVFDTQALDTLAKMDVDQGHEQLDLQPNNLTNFYQKPPKMYDYLEQLFGFSIKQVDNPAYLSSKVMTIPDSMRIASQFLNKSITNWRTLNWHAKSFSMYPIVDPMFVRVVQYGDFMIPNLSIDDDTINILKGKMFNNVTMQQSDQIDSILKESLDETTYQQFKANQDLITTYRTILLTSSKLGVAQDTLRNYKLAIKSSIKEGICRSEAYSNVKNLIQTEVQDLHVKKYVLVMLDQDLIRFNRFKNLKGLSRGSVRKNMYRLENKEKNKIDKQIESELVRFKDKNETVSDFDNDGKVWQWDDFETAIIKLMNYMFSPTDADVDLIPSLSYSGENLFEMQKQEFYKRYNMYSQEIKSSPIAHWLRAINKFATSLMAISNYKISNDSVVVDNCGLSNFYLIVRGFKRGIQTNSTKLFKLVYIPDLNCEDILNQCNCRNKVSKILDRTYIVTPWKILKMPQIKYGIELLNRFTQCTIGTTLQYPEIPINSEINKFRALLMLNNRRFNEIMLHDMKYLTCNLLGLLGCYNDLLESIFKPPKDYLSRYIIEKFLRGLPIYLETCDKCNLFKTNYSANFNGVVIQHPLSHNPGTLDELSNWLYCSYCMSKGVFTTKIEHRKNWQNVLAIHDIAREVIGIDDDWKTIDENCSVSFDRIFNHDLYYHTGTLQLVGSYLKNYLIRKGSVSNLWSDWDRIKSSDISSYANSSGLRKEGLGSNKSWGQKGHDVLIDYFNDFQSEMKEKYEEFNNLNVTDNMSSNQYNKELAKASSCRETIVDASLRRPLKVAEFNMADKVQWGGGREIYIMSHNLKNIQWALEQEFASIARQLENELISVPSNKKSELLYKAVKKDQEYLKFYCVFDCRKWAPLSNFAKYRHLITALNGVLPGDFLQLFDKFVDIYLNKRLYLTHDTYEDLLTTQGTPNSVKELIKDGDNYYLKMNYSFMMGIFNYLSSILHSAVQLFYKNIVVPYINKKFHREVTCTPFAHSDDSGLIFTFKDRTKYDKDTFQIFRQYLSTYETLQKGCNHLFSLKKCTVTLSYFEIISNIYFYGDILPVTSKYIAGHNINLTVNGPVSDMKSISSQVVEMLANGSSFEAAYLKEIMLSDSLSVIVYKHHINPISQNLILELGGHMDEHPLSILFFKQKANIYRIGNKDLDKLKKMVTLVRVLFNLGVVDNWSKTSLKFRYLKNDNRVSEKIISNDLVNKLPVFSDINDLPNNSFIFYLIKLRQLSLSQNLDYSIRDIDGLKLFQSYLIPGMDPCITVSGKELPLRNVFYRISYISDELICKIKFDSETDNFINTIMTTCSKFYNIMQNNNTFLSRLEYTNYYGRPKPTIINFKNMLLIEHSLAHNSDALLYRMDKRLILFNCNYKKYVSLSRSNLGILSLYNIINAVNSAELLEIMYLVTSNPGTNYIDNYNKLLEYLVQGAFAKKCCNSNIYFSRANQLYIDRTIQSDYHPDCICALYNSLKKNHICNPDDLKTTVSGIDIIQWLRTHEDRIEKNKSLVYSLFDYGSDEIAKHSNWFCILGSSQYRESFNWWLGKGKFISNLNGHLYSGEFSNHTIKKLVADGNRMTLKEVIEDLSILSGYSLRFEPVIGVNRPSIYCYGNVIGSGYTLTKSEDMINYIENIVINHQTIEDCSFKYQGNRLFYLRAGISYKVMVCNNDPCLACRHAIDVVDKNGDHIEYEFDQMGSTRVICNRSQQELVSSFKNTKIYKRLYQDNDGVMPSISMENNILGAPGTISSALINKSGVDADTAERNMYEYKLTPGMAKIFSYDRYKELELSEKIKNLLDVYINKFGKVSCRILKGKEDSFNKLIIDYGLVAIEEQLVKIDIDRGIQYYISYNILSLDTRLSKQLPDIIQDSMHYLSYSAKVRGADPYTDMCTYGQLIIDCLLAYRLSLSTYGPTYSDVYYPYLYLFLQGRKDCGQADLPCSYNFYWDSELLYLSLSNLFRTYARNNYGGNETKQIFRVWIKKLNDLIEMDTTKKGEIKNNSSTWNITPLMSFNYDDMGGYPLNMQEIKDWDCTCDDPKDSDIVFSDGINTSVSCHQLCTGVIKGILLDGNTPDIYLNRKIAYTYCGDKINSDYVATQEILAPVMDKNFNGTCMVTDKNNALYFDQESQVILNQLVEDDHFNYIDYVKFSTDDERLKEDLSKITKGQYQLSVSDILGKLGIDQNTIKWSDKLGINDFHDMLILSEGKQFYDSLSSGNYGINPESYDQMAGAELDVIIPSLTDDIFQGKLKVTSTFKRLFAEIIYSKTGKIDPDKLLLLRSVLNECKTVRYSDINCDTTAEKLYKLLKLFDDKKEFNEELPYPMYDDKEDTNRFFMRFN